MGCVAALDIDESEIQKAQQLHEKEEAKRKRKMEKKKKGLIDERGNIKPIDDSMISDNAKSYNITATPTTRHRNKTRKTSRRQNRGDPGVDRKGTTTGTAEVSGVKSDASLASQEETPRFVHLSGRSENLLQLSELDLNSTESDYAKHGLRDRRKKNFKKFLEIKICVYAFEKVILNCILDPSKRDLNKLSQGGTLRYFGGSFRVERLKDHFRRLQTPKKYLDKNEPMIKQVWIVSDKLSSDQMGTLLEKVGLLSSQTGSEDTGESGPLKPTNLIGIDSDIRTKNIAVMQVIKRTSVGNDSVLYIDSDNSVVEHFSRMRLCESLHLNARYGVDDERCTKIESLFETTHTLSEAKRLADEAIEAERAAKMAQSERETNENGTNDDENDGNEDDDGGHARLDGDSMGMIPDGSGKNDSRKGKTHKSNGSSSGGLKVSVAGSHGMVSRLNRLKSDDRKLSPLQAMTIAEGNEDFSSTLHTGTVESETPKVILKPGLASVEEDDIGQSSVPTDSIGNNAPSAETTQERVEEVVYS